MIESNVDNWENKLLEIADRLEYPPTPDIALGVRRRLDREKTEVVTKPWYGQRLAWVAAALLLIAAILLAVPQSRAAVINFFQIGSIRLFPDEPAGTPGAEQQPGAVGTPSPRASDVVSPLKTQTPALETNRPASLLDNLAGRATLAELEAEFGQGILQPEYPDGIGEPDLVFFQELFGPVGIQVWLDPAGSGQPWAVLYTLRLDEGAFGGKSHFDMDSLVETEVNGRLAYWVMGQHVLTFQDSTGQIDALETRLVEGNTLIWTAGPITYRLETGLPMEEAVRMAESMR